MVASLARNKERHAVMQRRLDAVGATYQFVDAIDAQKQLTPGHVSAKASCCKCMIMMSRLWRRCSESLHACNVQAAAAGLSSKQLLAGSTQHQAVAPELAPRGSQGSPTAVRTLSCQLARTQPVPAQMLGSWPGLQVAGGDGAQQKAQQLQQQTPEAYNLSIPWKCHLTTVAQMSCTLTHLFIIFSAHQAGLVCPAGDVSHQWGSAQACRSCYCCSCLHGLLRPGRQTRLSAEAAS